MLGLLYLSTALNIMQFPINDPTEENIKNMKACVISIAPAIANCEVVDEEVKSTENPATQAAISVGTPIDKKIGFIIIPPPMPKVPAPIPAPYEAKSYDVKLHLSFSFFSSNNFCSAACWVVIDSA